MSPKIRVITTLCTSDWETAVFEPGEKMSMKGFWIKVKDLNLPLDIDADGEGKFLGAFATDLRKMSRNLGKKWKSLRERQMRDNSDLGFTCMYIGDKRVVPGYRRGSDAEMAYLRIKRRQMDRYRRDALKNQGTFARPF